MYYNSEEVIRRLDLGQPATNLPGRWRVVLTATDSAWNPASTKRVIAGPCTLEYVMYPDGGIAVTESPAPQVGPRPPRSRRSTAPTRRNP